MDDDADLRDCSMGEARERLRILFKDGLLTAQQESVLAQVISASDSLSFGKKKVVHTLILDILKERNRQEIYEQVHLLRTYLGTIDGCENIANALDFAFRMR